MDWEDSGGVVDENEHARLLRTLNVVLTPAATKTTPRRPAAGPFARGRRAAAGEPDLQVAVVGADADGAARRALSAAALATGLTIDPGYEPVGGAGESLVFGERRAVSSLRRERRPSSSPAFHGLASEGLFR